MIILSLLMILLKVALVLLCLELSLISNVYVVVVLYPWMAHSKCVLVFLPALHHPFSLLQYSASRTFLSITRYTDNNISPYIHPDTTELYRSPDSSQSLHHHCRHDVVRSVFPNSTLHGCLFHYGQVL